MFCPQKKLRLAKLFVEIQLIIGVYLKLSLCWSNQVNHAEYRKARPRLLEAALIKLGACFGALCETSYQLFRTSQSVQFVAHRLPLPNFI